MKMEFLPFPRGQTARGTKDGGVECSPDFFNANGKALLDALAGESERGQVLICTTFLDKAITRCLKAQFMITGTNREQRANLIGSYRSILGTFGAKIAACRAFGLLEKEPSDALKAIQDIRNAFAHSDFRNTLASPEVADKIASLKKWLSVVENQSCYEFDGLGTIPLWIGELLLARELVTGVVDSRHLFLGAVTMLYLGLANILWAIRPEEYTGAIVSVSNLKPPAAGQTAVGTSEG